jgi:DNA repair exonuclease SbcCD nuclease subunit
MSYRFIHTADIHLDSPLCSLALRDPDLAQLIGNATRQAFVNTIDLCLNEQVDALLIAGDLYDGKQTSMKTARFLAAQLRRLHQADIDVFILRGNHDAQSKITKELTLPEKVKVFGGRAEAIKIERGKSRIPIVVHGLSYLKPHVPESLLPKFKQPVAGAFNIGMMHTSLEGTQGHDFYAPCRITDLQAAGFQYWALGHIHKRSVIEDVCTIVMPGIPQGREINESGQKSVSLVTVNDDGSVQVKACETSIAQFERVVVDVTGLDDWGDLVKGISDALREVRKTVLSPYLVSRIQVTGLTPLAWRIRRDLDLLKAEADDRASVIEKCWVEKIETQCDACVDADLSSDNPIAELHHLILSQVSQSEGFQRQAIRIGEDLRAQLPPECRSFLGADEQAFEETIHSLVRKGADDVIARLHAVSDRGSE